MFPYLATPHDGYHTPSSTQPAADLGAINQDPNCPVPVGAPETGIGPASSSDTGLVVGGGLALAGVAAAAGVVARSRMSAGAGAAAPIVAPHPRPMPSHRPSATRLQRTDDVAGEAGT